MLFYRKLDIKRVNPGMKNKQQLKSFTLVAFTWIVCLYSSLAETGMYINANEGLGQQTITSITQDPSGYLWVGTYNGINKFDGLRFQSFSNKNTKYIKEVKCLNNLLFIASSSGLAVFNTQNNTFEKNIPDELNNVKINDLFVDKDQRVYITTANNTFFAYKNGFSKIQTGLDSNSNRGSLQVAANSQNPNLIWLYNNKQVYIFDKASKKLKEYPFVKTTGIKKLIHLASDEFIVLANNQLSRIVNGASIIYNIPNKIIKLETAGHKLYCFDITGKAYRINNHLLTPVFQETDLLTTIFTDTKNNTWLGTAQNGLQKAPANNNSFNTIRIAGSTVAPETYAISALSKINNDYLAGTNDNGLFFFNPVTGTTTKLYHFQSKITSIIKTQAQTPDFWVTTLKHGIYRVNMQSGAIKQLNILSEEPTHYVKAIAYKQMLCIATEKSSSRLELIFYDPETKQKTAIELTDSTHAVANHVTSMAGDQYGAIYIGTTHTGLIRFSPGTEAHTIEDLSSEPNIHFKWYNPITKATPNYQINDVYIDKTEIIWVATNKGLVKFNKIDKTESVIRFTDIPQASSNVLALTEDNDDHLWLATPTHLIRYNTRSGNYLAAQNQANYNPGDYLNTQPLKDGEKLFFATTQGIIWFTPQQISFNKEQPEILFSNIEVTSANTTTQISNTTSKIKTGINDQLRITLATRNIYSAPQHTYAVMLHNFDTDWKYIANPLENIIQYNNLPPGKYIFKAKTANENFVWSPEKSISITIHEPILGKIIFITLSTVLLALAIIIITALYRKNLSLQRQQFLHKSKEKGLDQNYQLVKLVNLLPDYIYIKDRESRYIFGNTEMANVVHAGSAEKLIGKTDFDFYPKEIAEQFFHDEQLLLEQNRPIRNKIEPGLTIDGQKQWVSTTKIPIKDNKNQVIGLIGIGRDISLQKEAEDKLLEQSESLKEVNTMLEEKQEEIRVQSELIETEKNQLRTLIDHIPDAIYLKNERAEFITANKKLVQVMKASSLSDILNRTDHDFYEKEIADSFFKDDMSVIETGVAIIGREEFGFDSEGNERIILTSKVPITNTDNKVTGLIGIGRDITHLKETEQKLTLQTENLREINTILEERQEEIRIQSEHIEVERNQLRTLIDHLPNFIYFKDTQAKFITANKAMIQSTHVGSPEAIVGKSDFDFSEEKLARKYYNDDMHVINTLQPIINKEEKGHDHLGNEKVILTTKVPIIDSEGKALGLIGIGRDITKQKEKEKILQEQSESMREMNVLLEERQEELKIQNEHIETEHNQLRTLIDSMPDVIYFKDEEARFVTANDTQIKVLRAENLKSIIGKTDFDFYPKEMAEVFYKDDMQIMKSGKAIINKEEKGYDEEGSERYVSTTKVPLRNKDGHIFGLIGIGRDITKQKEAEKKLIEQSEYLTEVNVLLEERQEEIQQQSEELASQADNLREANEELERLNVTKDKFFSIIAHDLKNPFHAIMGFSELLSKEFKDMDDNQKLGLIDLINVSSESAFNLLENLLQWARTQTDKIKFSPDNISLKSVIDQNIRLLKVSALKKKINLVTEIGSDIFVFADENMLNTIIRNLASNAIKFTDAQGSVTISADDRGEVYQVNISDTGIGIDDETIDKLFRIDSYHTTSGTSGESGTGLGLIICNEFVKKNGGKLNVTSKTGVGSTFSFSLPKGEIK